MKFLNKQFTQETLKLALPVMLTQVGQVSVNSFDNIIVRENFSAQKHWQQFLLETLCFSLFSSSD